VVSKKRAPPFGFLSAEASIWESLGGGPQRVVVHHHAQDPATQLVWGSPEPVPVVFQTKEETDTRRFSIHRLAHYCLDFAERFATERVVPVVIFLRSGSAPRRLDLGGERYTYLGFRYVACELSAIPFERYRESDNPVARLNLPTMRYDPAQRV